MVTGPGNHQPHYTSHSELIINRANSLTEVVESLAGNLIEVQTKGQTTSHLSNDKRRFCILKYSTHVKTIFDVADRYIRQKMISKELKIVGYTIGFVMSGKSALGKALYGALYLHQEANSLTDSDVLNRKIAHKRIDNYRSEAFFCSEVCV